MSAVAVELPLVWEAEAKPGAGPPRPGAGPARLGAAVTDRQRGGGSAPAEPGGEPTLDSLLSGMWEGLAAHRSVPCPLCGGEVAPAYGAHPRPVGGQCRSCGTSLS